MTAIHVKSRESSLRDYIARKMKVTSNPFWKETLSYIFELISISGLSQDNILSY